jgi:hypothetical protein
LPAGLFIDTGIVSLDGSENLGSKRVDKFDYHIKVCGWTTVDFEANNKIKEETRKDN